MSLRARLAALTSLAVAFAIVAAAVAAWLLIRSTLLDQVDQQLLARVPDADRIVRLTGELPAEGFMGRDARVLQGDPIGVQVLDPDGHVARAIAPGNLDLELDVGEQQLLAGDEEGPHLQTVTVEDARYRMMSVPAPGQDGLLRLFQSLDSVETTLARLAWLLAVAAAAGVAVAGGLGWATARAGLRPVDRLVAAAEQVAATRDLAHRIALGGHEQDEIARLAAAVNAMLAALDEARAQQRELVENAAHELRTPLATLRNDLGLLLRAERHPQRRLSPDGRERLLADLEAEVAALSELVAEVVDLARGDVELEGQDEVDLRTLVDRAAARVRRVNPTVAVTVSGSGVHAAVRPVACERAVTNLVRNAVQVSGDGGLVEVDVQAAGGWACVQVLDRGPGIATEDLPHLFDRFYRGAGARERHGSGLGLAIVAQVAELHDGTVTADNRPGGGAVFTLRLPLREPAR